MSSECTEILYMRDAGYFNTFISPFLKIRQRDAPKTDPRPHLSHTGSRSGVSGLASALISKVRTEGKTATCEPSDN